MFTEEKAFLLQGKRYSSVKQSGVQDRGACYLCGNIWHYVRWSCSPTLNSFSRRYRQGKEAGRRTFFPPLPDTATKELSTLMYFDLLELVLSSGAQEETNPTLYQHHDHVTVLITSIRMVWACSTTVGGRAEEKKPDQTWKWNWNHSWAGSGAQAAAGWAPNTS